MNLLDIAVLAVLVLFVLHGIYRGFAHAFVHRRIYTGVAGGNSAAARRLQRHPFQRKLFNTMLYYTEGSEYVGNVELSKTNINEISTDTLNDVFSNADLPYPVAKNIADNIAKEQFADSGIVTLGDYFNQTIVSLFINILVFLLLFALMRIVLAFIINGIDYAWTLPQLRMADRAIAGGLGLVRGILAVFLLFMLLPLVLIVLQGKFRFITDIVNSSITAKFFYKSISCWA